MELIRRISNETGLRFDGQQLETAQQGIRKVLKRSGEEDPLRVLRQVSSNSPIFDDLVSELTIGETYFFREPARFDIISHELLPSLQARKGSDHRIRIWSAGCASGEEPYSIAMLLHQQRMLDRSHVLATDISHHALAKARAGRYRSWSLRGADHPLLKQFLIEDDGGYLVDERIRPHVVFEYLNLALDSYPSFPTGTWGLDLILCRNVLIYFNSETIAAVAKRFFNCLSPGGWVMLGASDPNISDFAPFDAQMTESGVVYHRPIQTATGGTALPNSAFQSKLSSVSHASGSAESTRPPYPTTIESSSESEPSVPIAPQYRSSSPGLIESEAAGQGNAQAIRSGSLSDPTAYAVEIRELAIADTEKAEQRCREAVRRYPISVELRFLHAVLLLELERNDEAVEAARRVVFLNRDLAIAHMTLGTALQRTGQNSVARRAFRNALRLCADRPASEIVPLSDGEHAGRLALSAKHHLTLLNDA
jgi:chemotaxis protein methyltransferase CheR